jgi:hypothetical protein
MENADERLYREARKRVRRKRKFYSHVLSYVAVGIFLTFINWYSTPGRWWVQWVWLGWGVGIFFHGVSLFRRNILFGDEWEERKIREEMERMKRQ